MSSSLSTHLQAQGHLPKLSNYLPGLGASLLCFPQPVQALEELAGLEGLICAWRRPVVLRAIFSTITSQSCHLLSFLHVESSLLTENLLSLSPCLMQSHLKILSSGTPGDLRCSLEISWTGNHPLWIAASVTSVPLTVPIFLAAWL